MSKFILTPLFIIIPQNPSNRNIDEPFIIHFSLLTIHFSLFTFHYSLFTIHFSLFTTHYSPYHRTNMSKIVNIANRIDATPFDVKNAAFSREMSSGLIIKC